MLYKGLKRHFIKSGPINIGLIGAGEFGTAILIHSMKNSLLNIVAVADIDIASAKLAFRRAGIDEENVLVCDSREKAIRAIENNKFVVLEDPLILMDLPIDVVVEATGIPEAGAKHAYEAIKSGKHVAMVNKEADSVVGPILKYLADKSGLVYTPVAGDQHGLLIELISWAEDLGLEVVCAGKSRDTELIYDRENRVIYQEGGKNKIKLSPNNLYLFDHLLPGKVETYVEGRKRILGDLGNAKSYDFCELTIVANATHLNVDISELHQPVLYISEIPEVLAPIEDEGILKNRGVLDVITCIRGERDAGLGGGVFITVSCDNAYTRRVLSSKGVIFNETKSVGLLYRPYHLCGVEAQISILYAGLLGVSLLWEYTPRYDLVKGITCDMRRGEILSNDHAPYFKPFIMPTKSVLTDSLAPGHIVTNRMLTKDIKSGTIITTDMLELSEDSTLLKLRKQQDEIFNLS